MARKVVFALSMMFAFLLSFAGGSAQAQYHRRYYHHRPYYHHRYYHHRPYHRGPYGR